MRRFVLLVLLAMAVIGCKNAKPEQEFFNQVSTMTKEELLARGDALAEKKRWEEARKYYSFLSDSFPNDPLGRRAALKVADTFFAQRDLESLTEAQLRFRDFSNRFPSDPSRAYALLMLGKCSFQQHRGPQKDLGPVREAAAAFRQVVALFPDSPEAKEASELYSRCQEDLARHELIIARYYVLTLSWEGAWQRLTYLFANYPDTKVALEALPLLQQVKAVRTQAGLPSPDPPGTPEPVPAPTPTPPAL